MSKLRVTVNHNKCVGSQLCVQFLPAVFKLNEKGQSVIITTKEIDQQSIISTAEQCPQCAIKVLDADTGEVFFPPAELEF